MSNTIILQDTTRQNSIVRKDSINLSVFAVPGKSVKSGIAIVLTEPDTTTICPRTNFQYITFKDSDNLVTRLDDGLLQDFPFVFTAKTQTLAAETKETLIRKLKPGDGLPASPFHYDWILPVVLFSFLIYGIIKSESLRMITGVFRFISFRGINEPASRDLNSIYMWQSTLLNFVSFINISLFAFFSAVWYDFLPLKVSSSLFWLILLGIVILSLTMRHIICVIIGNMSGEKEVFHEYLVSIYQGYRLSGMLLLLISMLICYTVFIPVRTLIYAGVTIFALQYFIRVFRLFMIFLNRHVSIFYLILYLCALEILPVVIIVKYVTGLI